jgi:hypothetical protein
MRSMGRAPATVVTLVLVLAGAAGGARAEAPPVPPPTLFGPDDTGDPPAVERKVKAELARAKQGKARTIILTAVATDEWGCDCLPFVYEPYGDSAPEGGQRFFFPVVTSGPNPGDVTAGSSAGRYELTGRFTRERITERAWRTRRKRGKSGDTKSKQPVFAVERWCFRKADDLPDHYAAVMDQMAAAGVTFCQPPR